MDDTKFKHTSQRESIQDIDDNAIVANKTWSSLQIIDALCDKFELTSPAVCGNLVENYPLSVTSYIEPIHQGKGTASPINVRNITGYTDIKLARCGKNIFNGEIVLGSRNDMTGELLPSAGSNFYRTNKELVQVKSGVQYTLSFDDGFRVAGYIFYFHGEYVGRQPTTNSTVTIPDNVDGLGFNLRVLGDAVSTVPVTELQIEVGNENSAYEPYRGSEYIAPFEQMIYGGRYNWEKGELIYYNPVYIKLDGSYPKNYVVWTQGNGLSGKIDYYNIYDPQIVASNSDQYPGTMTLADKIKFAPGSNSDGFYLAHAIYFGQKWIAANNIQSSEDLVQWFTKNPTTIVAYEKQVNTKLLSPEQVLALSNLNTLYSNSGDTTVVGRESRSTIF